MGGNWGTVQKFLLLTMIGAWWLVEAAPTRSGLGALTYDALDTDLKDLKYEVEEEDLDDYSKILDETDKSLNENDRTKTSGFKNKSASKKGLKTKHDIEDLKKFFQTVGAHDQGAYDDDEVYALADAFAGKAVGVKGNENRKYRKGTKTRGFHRVHHKDEYKKDKIFYEDDETSGAIKKVGRKGYGIKLNAGAGFDKGHFHHDRQKGLYGKQGYLDKGYSDKEFNAFSDSLGLEKSFSDER